MENKYLSIRICGSYTTLWYVKLDHKFFQDKPIIGQHHKHRIEIWSVWDSDIIPHRYKNAERFVEILKLEFIGKWYILIWFTKKFWRNIFFFRYLFLNKKLEVKRWVVNTMKYFFFNEHTAILWKRAIEFEVFISRYVKKLIVAGPCSTLEWKISLMI